MKLKAGLLVPPGAGPILTKTLLIMKLTVVLFLATCLQIHATGYAQKITLNKKNVSLQQVFKAIREQTSYHFFYKDALLKNTGTVDVDVKDVSVDELLSECLKQFPLTYTIINRTIIIKKKTENISEASVRQPAKIITASPASSVPNLPTGVAQQSGAKSGAKRFDPPPTQTLGIQIRRSPESSF